MKERQLGQHFLKNRKVAEKIVRAFLPAEGYVVEIGPGSGILTELLIRHRQHDAPPITAVELDPHLCRKLADRHPEGLAIVNKDILNLPLESLFPDSPVGLIGNLPYYISKDIIDWIIRHHPQIRKGVVMLQREFVDKLQGRPSNPQSLIFQYLFDAEILFDVSPGSFSPPPKVKSTVFRFRKKPIPQKPPIDIPSFYTFLKKCFRHRRKTLLNNLLPHYPRDTITQALHQHHLPTTTRPENLPLNHFLNIYSQLIQI